MKAMKTMKAMKAMKAGGSKAMTKGALTAAIKEERYLQCAKPLSHQDPREASNEGRHKDDVWQGSQSGGTTSKDRREGLRRRGIEEAGLEEHMIVTALDVFSDFCLPWESHGASWGGMSVTRSWLRETHHIVHWLPSAARRKK